ncbi:MAG: DEAD/DEAH box helicase [Candidatus Dadabacteria bacterium]|nr:DEAD/DEAH box helicase [Candidatus Dadabacteria bacterium]
MTIELGVTPNGRLHCYSLSEDASAGLSARPVPAVVRKAFEKGVGEGLFALAARRDAEEFSSGFRFWNEFACIYLTARCGLSTSAASPLRAIEFSRSPEIDRLLESAPPMRGVEYLSPAVFEDAWATIDSWLCDAVNRTSGGLGEFFRKRAPLWHQVGRVCFHLAENKRDEDYPFAFMATYTARLSDKGAVRHKPLGEALRQYAGDNSKEQLVNLLSPVYLASESSPLIKDLLDSGDIYHPLAWTPADACQFIRDLLLYEKAGLSIRLPDWWKKRPRPQVTVSIGTGEEKKFTAKSLLDFDIALTLGDSTLTREEWEELASSGEGLVLFKGQWVEVDGEKLNEALEHWEAVERSVAEDGISFVEGMRLLAGSTADLSAVEQNGARGKWSSVRAGEGLRKVLDSLDSPGPQALDLLGENLNATLRPYQQKGLGWLWYLTQLKLGACLADDMGLGKTVQVIALLLALKEKGIRKPSLLVLPASLLNNWKSELDRFSPSINYLLVHPSYSSGNGGCAAEEKDDCLSGRDLVITTYGMLLRRDWLLEREWQLAVIDEAQAIKNPGTRQTRAVKKLKAESRVALTGTPVENRLTDLWSLFDFICPGLLGSARRFREFVKSLDANGKDHYAPLRNLVRPYILRRLKTDKSIIADLPDKTEVYAYCGLGKKQAALYEKSVRELKTALAGEAEGIKRRGLVLSYITRFKQICNHPSHWLGDDIYSAADSGKFSRLGEICEEIASRQEKVLVFTQFREMTKPLAEFLAGCFGRSGLVLHGGTPVARRKQRVDMFQQEDGPPFFVLSIKAGGVGLNLTQASHVIHFDRWWNPAVENQATDRAFRIGQKRNVLVHKMVCQGTIEDKIDQLMTEKSALSDDILKGGGETLLTEMSNDELIDIVSLDVDKVLA